MVKPDYMLCQDCEHFLGDPIDLNDEDSPYTAVCLLSCLMVFNDSKACKIGLEENDSRRYEKEKP